MRTYWLKKSRGFHWFEPMDHGASFAAIFWRVLVRIKNPFFKRWA